MSHILTLDDLHFIHEEMCLVWGMDTRNPGCGESWISDETPPWNPTWSDFLEELPSHMFEPCYSLVFPTLEPPDRPWLITARCIPLKFEHMKKIKNVIDIMEAENEAFAHDPATLENFAYHLGIDMSIPLDEALADNEEVIMEDAIIRIHNLEPRELFQDADETEGNDEKLADCSRGLAIIEECMESENNISEGQYLELANIFKRLSV